jgi:hypothetical protein
VGESKRKKEAIAKKNMTEYTCPACGRSRMVDTEYEYYYRPDCIHCDGQMMLKTTIQDMTFYRYEGYERIYLIKFKVVRVTKKGFWIKEVGYGTGERWISGVARKTWAKPTKEEALASYRIRKEWQIKHLERQLDNAREGLRQTEGRGVDEVLKRKPKEILRRCNPFESYLLNDPVN